MLKSIGKASFFNTHEPKNSKARQCSYKNNFLYLLSADLINLRSLFLKTIQFFSKDDRVSFIKEMSVFILETSDFKDFISGSISHF